MLDAQTLQERIRLHQFPRHQVVPAAHLRNARDRTHFDFAISSLRDSLKWPNNRVLDIGCFDGWLPLLLCEHGYECTGIDIVQELVDSGNAYAIANSVKYKALVGAFEDIQLASEPFDCVLSFETLEHMELDHVGAAVAKMERYCKPGGLILISLPDQRHEDNAQHRFTPTEDLVRASWQDKKDFRLQRVEYPLTSIPANWLVRWTNG